MLLCITNGILGSIGIIIAALGLAAIIVKANSAK